MKKLVSILWLVAVLIIQPGYAQVKDTVKTTEKAKSGYNLGALPAISFDSDLGFQYGLIVNLFNYGDGSLYPDYKWSIFAEWSRTTKGSGTNQLFFDSKYLLPYNIRITADFSLLTEQALDFYGFNGFEVAYHPEFEDDQKPAYISRMFYRHRREQLRMSADFQGDIHGNKWRWLLGYGRFDTKIGSVDIQKLNKGLDEDDKLPDVDGLYDDYVNYGLIEANEADGGVINSIKMGLVYDTRDNEPNPQHGIWAEALVMTIPAFLGNEEAAYTKLALLYRQYVPVINQKVTFAYRVGWQGTISGETPFYMQPYMINTFTKVTTNDGLGGAKSLRGIMRNRVVGDAIAFANLEFRYKFIQFNRWNQNFYFSLNAFGDLGRVTKPIDVKKNNLPGGAANPFYFDQLNDGLHTTYGAGLRFAMNQNFVIGIDHGISSDQRDGKSGTYINIGFLF